MEILAQVQLFEASVVMDTANPLLDKLSLQTKTQVAFHKMKRGCFDIARNILEQAIIEVEELYSANSTEFLLTGTSLVICHNATAREAAREAWS